MDSRLMYHTSIDSKVTPLALPLKKVNYYTSLQSTDIALDNLKKLNNKLDDTNIITLAYLANNPYLNDQERENFKKQLQIKAMIEYEKISIYVNDIIRRNQDCSSNVTECDN